MKTRGGAFAGFEQRVPERHHAQVCRRNGGTELRGGAGGAEVVNVEDQIRHEDGQGVSVLDLKRHPLLQRYLGCQGSSWNDGGGRLAERAGLVGGYRGRGRRALVEETRVRDRWRGARCSDWPHRSRPTAER